MIRTHKSFDINRVAELGDKDKRVLMHVKGFISLEPPSQRHGGCSLTLQKKF